MKGESDIAKVGCGIQMKEVTSHELGVITGSDITSGSTSAANNFCLRCEERKKFWAHRIDGIKHELLTRTVSDGDRKQKRHRVAVEGCGDGTFVSCLKLIRVRGIFCLFEPDKELRSTVQSPDTEHLKKPTKLKNK
ncbi:hypothetical protein DY000_02026696 [Brassica cretica]|uniref:Uncharacterized protein n=1 Tax=Brassica cretica TaxID=69181 RepID=A0ABQ7E350_BRACR|nr:hypothetical protein DY000_02026696 [Brassica cretica]